MEEEMGFIQAMADAPDDESLRLIYADWLEENGHPERSELIRNLRCLSGLVLDRHNRYWHGSIQLPFFASCRERYYLNSHYQFPITVGRVFTPGEETENDDSPAIEALSCTIESLDEGPPTAAQVAALRRLVGLEAAAFDSVMERLSDLLIKNYIGDRELDFSEVDITQGSIPWQFPGGAAAFLEFLSVSNGISQTLCAQNVYVTRLEEKGLAIVLVDFRCTWESHGMMAAIRGCECIEAGSELSWGWGEWRSP